MKKYLLIIIIAILGAVSINKAFAQTYDPLAVRRINDLIYNNGLNEIPNDPESWSESWFVGWSYDEPKQIEWLSLQYRNLTGNASLAGLTTLISLNCYENNLTELDLTNCSKLDMLACRNNSLTKLNLTNCTKLTDIYCVENHLTTLDLSKCTELRMLGCTDNNLTELNLTNCRNLDFLNCAENSLTELNLSNCTQMTGLICRNNNLTNLDLTGLNRLNLSFYDASDQNVSLILYENEAGQYTRSIFLNNPTFDNDAVTYSDGVLKCTDRNVTSTSFIVQTNKAGFEMSGTLNFIYANDLVYEISQPQTVAEIQSGLQNVINNANISDRVVVIGSKTDANTMLQLTIPTERIVAWKATYESGASFNGAHLISFSGDGTFDVAGGTLMAANANTLTATGTNSTIIVSGTGTVRTSGTGKHAIFAKAKVEIKDHANISGEQLEVVYSEANNAVIIMSGGTVTATATAENAICTLGKGSKIYVSGGYVSNNATVPAAAIVGVGQDASIYVSGNTKVEAKGYGPALSARSVKVSGNAQISNNLGGNFFPMATVRGDYSVDISENARITAFNDNALFGAFITISGNSIVEAKDNAVAVYIYGYNEHGYKEGRLSVKDKAQVMAANNYAVSYHDVQSYFLSITGGLVFAYGSESAHVIQMPSLPYYPTDLDGIIVAWNKEAGNTNYKMYSTDDIFKYPESAVAYWDIKDAQYGISYANGENAGFIPLDVTILSVKESNLPNIAVYPNPTTGELRIESGELRINNVEIFDVYGRKLKAENSPPFMEGWQPQADGVVNISHLPAGIYFLKITTAQGEVTKKVVKR